MDSSGESVWIIGYGKFGRRAVQQMIKNGCPPRNITIIDREAKDDIPNDINSIEEDGVAWFLKNFQESSKTSRIIPALPIHLAAQWLKGRLFQEKIGIEDLPVPEKILTLLPNTYRLSAAEYAVSHADFLCPPDCSEPEQFCTITGRPRPTPLYDLLHSLSSASLPLLTIVSRQFSPGVGGFHADDLWQLLDKARQHREQCLLIATACKCHGIITSLRFMDQ